MTTETAIVTQDAPPQPITVSAVPASLFPAKDELQNMLAFAQQIINATGLIPTNIDTPGKALAILETGRELGVYPMTAFRHLYVVNGRVEIETRLMVGIIKARRPDIRFSWPVYETHKVTCRLERPGQEPIEVTYTTEDAKASGQYDPSKPNSAWVRFPRDLNYAAATKRACRIGCPDLINAIDAHLTEGAMMAAAIAESMPEAPPQAIEAAFTNIPQEQAYNEGDEPGDIPVEVQAPDPGNPHEDLANLIRRVKKLPDKDTRNNILDQLKRLYPEVFANGRISTAVLTPEAARKAAEALELVLREHEPKQEATA